MPVAKESGGKGPKRRKARRTPTGDFERDNTLQEAIRRHQAHNGFYGDFTTNSALEAYLQQTRAQPMSPSTRRANDRNVRERRNQPGGLNMRQEPQTTIKGKKSKGSTGGGGGGFGGGGGYDPWAGLPTVGDVQSDSLGILDNLVQGMLFNEGPSYDYESGMQAAAEGIRRAYAADIAAIRSNRKAERKDTKRARNEIEKMYAGLARSYGRDAKQAEAAGDASVAEVQGIANEATQNLQAAHSQMLQERAALAGGLNVPEALNDPNINAEATTQQGVNRLQQQGAGAAMLESQMGEANSQFFERGQAGARMEGDQKSIELLNRFLDFKRQSRDQIAQLKGQRARDVSASNASIAQQAAELQAEADAETWARLMEYMGMRSDLEQQNIDNSFKANEQSFDQRLDRANLQLDRRGLNHDIRSDNRDFALDRERARTDRWKSRQDVALSRDRLTLDAQKAATTGADGKSPFPSEFQQPADIISQSLPPQKAVKVTQILNGLRNSVPWTTGVHRMNKQDVKMNPNLAAQLALQAGRRAGLTGEELRILQMAAAASI